MMISYKIACASGVLAQGGSSDFLICILQARETKREWLARLPYSTLRVQLFYPNNKRVPSEHIKSALRALADPTVSAAVACRRVSIAQIPPARSEARTAGICAIVGRVLAVAVDVGFCQAGVVAPPDSPDLGNLPNSPAVCLKG
ncbi:hypothetical protein BH11PSE12_BH11PSE12_20690 [soil metagenome]